MLVFLAVPGCTSAPTAYPPVRTGELGSGRFDIGESFRATMMMLLCLASGGRVTAGATMGMGVGTTGPTTRTRVVVVFTGVDLVVKPGV